MSDSFIIPSIGGLRAISEVGGDLWTLDFTKNEGVGGNGAGEHDRYSSAARQLTFISVSSRTDNLFTTEKTIRSKYGSKRHDERCH